MRMEELSESRFIKSTDTVERYLLNLVQEYFKNANVAASTSKEYIIQRALQRMKEEISYDTIGVLSITLPDGKVRTGAVSISLDELGGEPKIKTKLSAFNVPFGNVQNTACEGNDPRLSDARIPVKHEHTISDINGLEGMLSSISGKLDKANSFNHTHSNKDVLSKLTYSGMKTSIDLYDIETAETDIKDMMQDNQDAIANYKTTVDQKIIDINTAIQQVKNDINTLKTWCTQENDKYLAEAKTYADDAIKKANDDIKIATDNLLTPTDLEPVIQAANKFYTLVGSYRIDLNSLFDFNAGIYTGTTAQPIPQSIIDEIKERGTNIDECQFELNLEYVDDDGKTCYSPIPYIFMSSLSMVGGVVHAGVSRASQEVIVNISSDDSKYPVQIIGGDIVLSVYSKEPVTI